MEKGCLGMDLDLRFMIQITKFMYQYSNTINWDSKFNLPKVRFMIWVIRIWHTWFKSPFLLFCDCFFKMNHESWLIIFRIVHTIVNCLLIDAWSMVQLLLMHGAITIWAKWQRKERRQLTTDRLSASPQ